jgi:hypothetical protein
MLICLKYVSTASFHKFQNPQFLIFFIYECRYIIYVFEKELLKKPRIGNSQKASTSNTTSGVRNYLCYAFMPGMLPGIYFREHNFILVL